MPRARQRRRSRWEFGETIGKRREEFGLNQGEVAKNVGISRPAYTQIESGSKRQVSGDTINRLAAFLDLDPGILLRLAKEGTVEGRDRLSDGRGRLSREDTVKDGGRIDTIMRGEGAGFPLPPTLGATQNGVPVVETRYIAAGGVMLLTGAVVDHGPRPQGIQNTRNVFGIRMLGDSMYPAFRDGALIYIDPGRPARPGDDILIEIQSSETGGRSAWLIRRLISMDDRNVVVEHYKPRRLKTAYPRLSVRSVAHVLTMNELMGVS